MLERYILGTRLNAFLWQHRHYDEAAHGSAEHPHRAFLADRIMRYGAITAVFEVGVGSGANLIALRARNPQLRVFGTDINPHAIGLAASALGGQSPEVTDIRVGAAHDLSWVGDRSVDVALADATLMYLGPDRIEAALRELLRISRRAVVLNEWHTFDRAGAGPTSRWWYGHWVHDYEALLRKCGARTVSVERLPAGQWGPGGWEAFGAIVEATT